LSIDAKAVFADPDRVDCRSGGFAAKLYLFEERFGEGIGCIGQSGHASRRRQHVADQLDTLASEFGADASDTGDISARPRKARDKPRGDRISRIRHNDRDFARRLLCRLSGGREPRDDYIHVETDQLGGQFGKPVEVSFSRSKLESNVLPLDVPQIAQPLPKLPPKRFGINIANDQCADGRRLRLLRVGRERPHSRRAAEQHDELAPLGVEHRELLSGHW
jgi:hypothetical protein